MPASKAQEGRVLGCSGNVGMWKSGPEVGVVVWISTRRVG